MSTTVERTPVQRLGRWRVRALVVLAAVLAALVVWTVAVPVAGIDLTVAGGGGPQQVGPVAVVLVSLLVGLAGTGVLALLERVTRRSRRTWLVIALVVLLLSLAGPLGAATLAATIALVCMHLVVGLTVALGLARTAR